VFQSVNCITFLFIFQFESDGYVVLEDFLSEAEVQELRSECDNLIKNMPQESKRTVFSTVDSNVQQVRGHK
jgi:hypothetical protein